MKFSLRFITPAFLLISITMGMKNNFKIKESNCRRCEYPVYLTFINFGLRLSYVKSRWIGKERVVKRSDDTWVRYSIEDCYGSTRFIEFGPNNTRIEGYLKGDSICDSCENWRQINNDSFILCHKPGLDGEVLFFVNDSLSKTEFWENGSQIPAQLSLPKNK